MLSMVSSCRTKSETVETPVTTTTSTTTTTIFVPAYSLNGTWNLNENETETTLTPFESERALAAFGGVSYYFQGKLLIITLPSGESAEVEAHFEWQDSNTVLIADTRGRFSPVTVTFIESDLAEFNEKGRSIRGILNRL
jgi:hypothetical protein